MNFIKACVMSKFNGKAINILGNIYKWDGESLYWVDKRQREEKWQLVDPRDIDHKVPVGFEGCQLIDDIWE